MINYRKVLNYYHRTHIRAIESYERQNNAYVNSFDIFLSLPLYLSLHQLHYLQPDLSGIHHCRTGGAGLRDRGASWETVSKTLHVKLSASQDLTPIKTTHPDKRFLLYKSSRFRHPGISLSAKRSKIPIKAVLLWNSTL